MSKFTGNEKTQVKLSRVSFHFVKIDTFGVKSYFIVKTRSASIYDLYVISC